MRGEVERKEEENAQAAHQQSELNGFAPIQGQQPDKCRERRGESVGLSSKDGGD